MMTTRGKKRSNYRFEEINRCKVFIKSTTEKRKEKDPTYFTCCLLQRMIRVSQGNKNIYDYEKEYDHTNDKSRTICSRFLPKLEGGIKVQIVSTTATNALNGPNVCPILTEPAAFCLGDSDHIINT